MIHKTNKDYIIVRCIDCGSFHKHSFGLAGVKFGRSPFNIPVGSTLVLSIDGGQDITVTFATGDFPNFASVTSKQLIDKLSASVPGTTHVIDDNDVLMESKTNNLSSSIFIKSGTAISALGTYINNFKPLFIGFPSPPGLNFDMIRLRNCNCGHISYLNRTFDVMPDYLHGTFGHLHRCAVNALAEHLKANGWLHPDLNDFYTSDARVLTDKFNSIDNKIDQSVLPPLNPPKDKPRNK